MKVIKGITIVTGQGVAQHFASGDTMIVEGLYYVCGDPYNCFCVIKNGKTIHEIRCVHNLAIEYKSDE